MWLVWCPNPSTGSPAWLQALASSSCLSPFAGSPSWSWSPCCRFLGVRYHKVSTWPWNDPLLGQLSVLFPWKLLWQHYTLLNSLEENINSKSWRMKYIHLFIFIFPLEMFFIIKCIRKFKVLYKECKQYGFHFLFYRIRN